MKGVCLGSLLCVFKNKRTRPISLGYGWRRPPTIPQRYWSGTHGKMCLSGGIEQTTRLTSGCRVACQHYRTVGSACETLPSQLIWTRLTWQGKKKQDLFPMTTVLDTLLVTWRWRDGKSWLIWEYGPSLCTWPEYPSSTVPQQVYLPNGRFP